MLQLWCAALSWPSGEQSGDTMWDDGSCGEGGVVKVWTCDNGRWFTLYVGECALTPENVCIHAFPTCKSLRCCLHDVLISRKGSFHRNTVSLSPPECVPMANQLVKG